jgi:branched-chain amino acid transport system permease protein
MRAVVDNRGLAALNGVRPELVSMFAWALGSMLAAISGILLAPEVLLRVDALTLLILDAFAAAIFGRLRNLPLTFAGGLLLGLANAYALGFLDFEKSFNGRFANFPSAIPTVFLFFVLLALPQARIHLGRLGPRIHVPRVPTIGQALAGSVALVAVIALVSGQLSLVNQNRLTLGMCTALIMLSLVPLTGWAGQVNLAVITFVGVGAWAMFEVSGRSGNPIGLIAAGALAIPFGIAMAGPALRLQGLYLALASMAFARAAELLFFTQPEVFGNNSPRLARVSLGGYRFTDQRPFLILVAVLFSVMGVFLIWLRRGRFGRRLIAMRDSPAACVTMGVSIPMTKLLVFTVSAAMAGFGGAVLAVHRGTAGQQDFQMLAGLPLVLLAVVGGVAMVSGVLFGGIFSIMLVLIKETFHLSWLQSLEVLGPGTAALGVANAPNGAAAEIAARLAPYLPWRPDARAEAADRRRRVRDADPGNMGLSRRFTNRDLFELDDVLSVPKPLRAAPLPDEGLGGEPAPTGATDRLVNARLPRG